MRILFCLILTFIFSIRFESAAQAATLLKLESIAFDEVCGVDTSGNTACIKGTGETTVIPDSVGALTHGFASQLMSCGIDGGGVKCWKEWGGSEIVEGETVAKAIRRFLKVILPESARLSAYNICGEVRATGELKCVAPLWSSLPTKTIRIKPAQKITAIGVDEEMVCWADGNSVESKISCLADRPSWSWPADMSLKGLTEIAVRSQWICARSKTEAQCWNPKGVAVLTADITTALSWSFKSDGLCALTRDLRVVCVDPVTGAILPSGLGHEIPTEYSTANPNVKLLWTSESGGCVVLNAGTVNCWSWWNPTATPVVFSRTVVELFGSNYLPCARLDNGQAECRLSNYDSQTLKDTDRIRVAFGGWNKCFWNSSGVDCRGRIDNFSFRSVRDFSASSDDEAICVVGVPPADPAGFETVQCSSYNPGMKSPPHELRNPISVATSSDQACALSDEGLTCWGTPYLETTYPTTVVAPKKLVMSSRHGCVIDQFGLACWGELSSLALEVPSGLDQPGRVVDVAVGSSRTCAILDTGTVECWGRDYELSGPPPFLSGGTSILGRGGLFCALDTTGLHCWGGDTELPK